MNTGELLLRAVLCDPGDDTARLAFADYQEEHGGEGWAYLIRQWGQPTVCPVGASADVCFYPGPAAGTHYTVKLAEGRVGVQYVVRRGFVDEVRLPAAAFTEDFARELFGRHPVTRVVLTDKQPHETGRPVTDNEYPGWMWCCDPTMALATDQWGIPRYLFDQLADSILMAFGTEWGARPSKFYAAADDGLAALSDACVAWGRSLAGLPPLPHASGGA